MKRLCSAFAAVAMIASFSAAPAFAQAKPDDKLVAACKGKKAGDKVKVDGKDAVCPK